MYEPGRQTQDWDFGMLMANASEIFGSNGANQESSVLSSIDDDPQRVDTDRIDVLSPRGGHDDSRVTPSVGVRKRRAPEDPSPSRRSKKQKIEPSSKDPPVHESPPLFAPAHPSEEPEAPRRGRKSKAKSLSAMREEDCYYRQNTSPEDQIYFHNVIKKLREADYLGYPQRLEPTISSKEGVVLVGDSRAEGPGRASEGEPVYSILVDKPSSGPFLCWICGHIEKQRKGLRALGHVREHFEHKPWKCTQDHRTIQGGNGKAERRRVTGKDGLW